jgi:hypothetical protein
MSLIVVDLCTRTVSWKTSVRIMSYWNAVNSRNLGLDSFHCLWINDRIVSKCVKRGRSYAHNCCRSCRWGACFKAIVCFAAMASISRRMLSTIFDFEASQKWLAMLWFMYCCRCQLSRREELPRPQELYSSYALISSKLVFRGFSALPIAILRSMTQSRTNYLETLHSPKFVSLTSD